MTWQQSKEGSQPPQIMPQYQHSGAQGTQDARVSIPMIKNFQAQNSEELSQRVLDKKNSSSKGSNCSYSLSKHQKHRVLAAKLRVLQALMEATLLEAAVHL